ncbi:hypothetical protein COPG_00085 [Colwellia phage 9A]|uniref:Uncharacterized protein n=1 Tax=Colwellia phage 9A TaxID=765765 RepID=I3UMG6_9CAUD|nr:hypothetical protein COPG_00085 [Colwellia phage 9A]AFK66681.1 hypothetical protein COPG_00085 [Colwellia phage 9A]
MDNQHRSINGYRELSEMEVEQMNDVKWLEAKFLKLFKQGSEDVSEETLNEYKRSWSAQLKEIGAMRQAESDSLLEGGGGELTLDQLNQSKRCLNESRRNLKLIKFPLLEMDLEVTAAIQQMSMWAVSAVGIPDALEI